MPKVPACASCNSAKSKLEHYLTAVLPFGAQHADASEILTTMVPARLKRNAKLQRALSAGQGRAWVSDGWNLHPTMTIPVDADDLKSLFKYVARGLSAYHWQVQIPARYHVGAGILTREGEALVRPMLEARGRARVRVSLGNGAFNYDGNQGLDDPCITVWRFQVYGGVVLGGDREASHETPSTIWAMTGTEPLDEIFGK